MDSFQTDFLDIIFKKFSLYTGRARRREYWMFQLWFFVISVCISVLAGLFSAFSPKLGMIIYVIFVIAALIMLVPSFCLTVRRLHDIGHSGWLVLLYVLPLLHLIPFIMTLLDSHPGENKYGPNPKGV